MGVQPLSAAAAQINFNMDYSVNGGSSWTNFLQWNNNNNDFYIGPAGNSTIHTSTITSTNVLNLIGSNTAFPAAAISIYPASTITNTNTTNQTLLIKNTYNQATSSTSNNYDLVVNRTQTSIGTASSSSYNSIQRLISGQVNSVEVFGVDNNGKLNYATGSISSSVGTVNLTAGTATVSNKLITTYSMIHLTAQSALSGNLYISNRVTGSSFTITSTNSSDTPTVAYFIIN
jgi:hypothetical protein